LWKTPWKVHGKRKTVIEGARHFDSETRGKTVYILVVDDDKFANDLVRFALSKEGYEVETTDNPRGALQMIEKREQALLFLNRRGYAPLTLCRACGHRFACTICDAWLVDHRFRQRLVCHHCGFSMPRPNICPHCQAEESLVAVGPGVEPFDVHAAS